MPQERIPATRLMVSLPILIVITAVCIAVSAGAVATWSFNAQSRRAIDANLSVLAHDKRSAVEALMHSVSQDIVTTTGNPPIRRALDNLATSIKVMAPDVRAALPQTYSGDSDTDHAAGTIRGLQDYYGRAYDVVNPWFRALARELDYPDIVFIDRMGNVGYSLAKRSDFGGRIHEGALKGSVLEEVFDRASALPPGATITTDFHAYAPARGPVALAGGPIYDDVDGRQDLIGVLVFELPSTRLDAVLNDPEGFGTAGEALLVGADGLLRSNSRFGGGGDILHRRFAAPALLGTEPHQSVVDFTDSRGVATIGAATPVLPRGLGWTVVATENADEVFQPAREMTVRIAVICLLATTLLAGAAVAVAARIARPVLRLIERFDAALSNMQHALVMIDRNDRLILCNSGFRDMYALPPGLTATGTPLAWIDAHRQATGSLPARQLGACGPDAGRHELADGRVIEVFRNALPSGGYVVTHQNITAAVQAQQQISYLATHDPLTGLLNRASLTRRLQDDLAHVGPDRPMAVLCLDLDYFKTVNDTLGHPIGDALLRVVADRLQHCLLGREVLARLGGDEFVILQDDITAPDEARLLAERLIEAIAVPFDIEGHLIVIGLSVGIAVSPADGTDADTLIKNADTALYRAKAEGRRSCRFFEAAMDAQLQVRRQLELDLRRALADEQFELDYQPVYDTATEAVTGVEALLRWRHPTRGRIAPGDFIPIAEEMGVIVPIGEWVIRRACADAATWPANVRIAVNLSPLQLKSPTLVAVICEALHMSRLSPRRLELEITETVLLSDDEATLSRLYHLKSLGLRIAMDDFGTGYSSLSYLRSFPFDRIKIDQSFVRELGARADAAAIIKAISDLATTLGIDTTVEGIETIEQLHLVRKQGCTEVQGYYMSRPVAAAKISAMLQAGTEVPRLTA